MWPTSFWSCPCRIRQPCHVLDAVSIAVITERGRGKFPRLTFVGVRQKGGIWNLDKFPQISEQFVNINCQLLPTQLTGFLSNYLSLWSNWQSFYQTMPDQDKMFPTKSHEAVSTLTQLLFFFWQIVCFWGANRFPLDSFCFCPDCFLPNRFWPNCCLQLSHIQTPVFRQKGLLLVQWSLFFTQLSALDKLVLTKNIFVFDGIICGKLVVTVFLSA